MCQCSQLVLTGDFPRQKLQLRAIDIASFYETKSKKTKVMSHLIHQLKQQLLSLPVVPNTAKGSLFPTIVFDGLQNT